MRDFFKTKKFKVLMAVVMLLLGFMIYTAANDGFAGVPSQMVNLVVTPLQKIGTAVTNAADNFFTWVGGINYLWDENAQLKDENQKLQEQLADYDELKRQNDQYKEYLGIREENEDMTFSPAFVIGRDSQDKYGSFTIDKGSRDGISPGDPVITSSGIVGRVWEVSITSSKVMTVQDASINIGVMVSSTKDTGIISGDLSLSESGYTKMMYLDRNSTAAPGDIITTTGVSGLFPKGLIVGTIKEIHTETHGKSLYAVVEPVVPVTAVKDVFVVTSFSGEIAKEQ